MNKFFFFVKCEHSGCLFYKMERKKQPSKTEITSESTNMTNINIYK